MNISSGSHIGIIALTRIVVGYFELYENFTTALRLFLPMYYFSKTIICLWLMHPHMQGSAFLFDAVISRWIPLIDDIFERFAGKQC